MQPPLFLRLFFIFYDCVNVGLYAFDLLPLLKIGVANDKPVKSLGGGTVALRIVHFYCTQFVYKASGSPSLFQDSSNRIILRRFC
jgi:hypothetical protein